MCPVVLELRDREYPLEVAVSNHIGLMSMLWLDVPDEPGPSSLRGFIEANAIGLLSNEGRPALDSASTNWLGHHAERPAIRASHLCNVSHGDDEYARVFLNRMGELISGI